MKMNKLIIAAAIVCVAAFTQGAQIKWNSSANYVTSAGVVQTSATADVGTFVLVFLGNGTADWSSAKVVNEGTVTYATVKGTTTAKVSGDYSFTYGASGAPQNGDIFGVMFRDGDGNLTKLQSGGADIDTTFTVSGMTDNQWGQTFVFSSSAYSAAPGGSSGGDVPEPTSGILLLLGMGALALRRKQK